MLKFRYIESSIETWFSDKVMTEENSYNCK